MIIAHKGAFGTIRHKDVLLHSGEIAASTLGDKDVGLWDGKIVIYLGS